MRTFTNARLLCSHCYQLEREEGWSEKKNRLREVTRKLRNDGQYIEDNYMKFAMLIEDNERKASVQELKVTRYVW